MQRINFTQDTLNTLKRSARCSFANAVYKLTMKAQQGLKCDDLFKKSVLMNEVNKLLCKYKLDTCISFHPALEAGISSWYFGIGSFTGLITYNLIIDGVETFIGSGSSVENIVIDINNNTEGTGVTAVLGEGGYFTIYSPAGCFIKADLTGSKDPEGSIPQTITTFTKGKCPQEETCVEYTEEELNCITPQDLQLLFEFTHRYKETLAKSTKRITSPSTSSSSPSPSDCCNWGSIGGSIGNQSDLITYLANIQKNYISIDNEGTEITNDVKSINFTGSGVNATYSGSGNVTVDIPGGGGGFECADLERCNISLLTNDAGYITEALTYTVNNGLTENPANNFKLGGTLVEDTTIYNDTFDFTVSRSNSGDSILGLNTSSGRGVVGSSVNSHGVVGLSTNGKGISGVSTNGVGVDASSGTSRAGQFGISPASNNSVRENIILYRNVASNAAGASGIGQSLIFASAASDANMYYTNTLVSKWTDATLATRTSQFIITTVNNAVSQDSFTINGDGEVILNKYGQTPALFPGTPVWSLGVDASGNVIETTPNTFTFKQVISPSDIKNGMAVNLITDPGAGKAICIIEASIQLTGTTAYAGTTGVFAIYNSTSGTLLKSMFNSGTNTFFQTNTGSTRALYKLIDTNTNAGSLSFNINANEGVDAKVFWTIGPSTGNVGVTVYGSYRIIDL